MFRYMLLVVWCSLLTLSPTFSVLARSISPTLYDFPATIAGLELKAVLNSSNTACLSENEIRIALNDSDLTEDQIQKIVQDLK